MEIIKSPSFDYLSKRKVSYLISSVVILIGLVSIIMNGGLRYHIDFTGGLSLEVAPSAVSGHHPLTVEQIREALARNNVIAEIQELPRTNSFLIKTKPEGMVSSQLTNESMNNEYGDAIVKILQFEFPEYTQKDDFIRSSDFVGPRAGADLRKKAVNAVLISLLFLLIYIWIRFRFTWGFICAFGLLHDTMVALAILSLSGKEIGMTVLAGLLTIIGYSINNTIVIFDRFRENLKLYRKDTDAQIINRSVNETLNRNIVLSFTTLLAIFALLIFGGSVIHDFAFTLMVGIIAGTFSSIFIVSGLIFETMTALNKRKTTKQQKK